MNLLQTVDPLAALFLYMWREGLCLLPIHGNLHRLGERLFRLVLRSVGFHYEHKQNIPFSFSSGNSGPFIPARLSI